MPTAIKGIINKFYIWYCTMKQKERKTDSLSIGDRINKYIDKIDPITAGSRNDGLYDTGILLRSRFGLTGDDLESALSHVNQTKCTPPLPEHEVSTITKSVGKADAPGEKAGSEWQGGNAQKKKHLTSAATLYSVSASAEGIPVSRLLQKEVSLYLDCKANTPNRTATIGDVWGTFKTGSSVADKIKRIRNELDNDKRNKLKKDLPAVVFHSEPQATRKNADCMANGIICLDFDHITEPGAKDAIALVDYVFAVAVSVSGQGLFALAAYEGKPDLKSLLAAMQADFCYKIDMSGSDLCRLRYVTLDESIIIKDKVHPAILTEQTESAEPLDDTEPLRYVPFPVDFLPLTLSRWVIDTQRCINLKDPAMPAVAALAVISSIIGSSCRIGIKQGYTEPAALFAAIVADSGNAKSPAIEAATKHLTALQAEKLKQWKRETHEYDQELHEWKNKSTPQRRATPEPKPPQSAERLIISDATIEAVAGILENNPLGVLLNRDELNGFFAGMDAYRKSATDLQSWIEIYEGRGFTVDRKTTGTVHIDTPSVSIIGGVQTRILQQTIKERADFIHSGFGSRFLFVMPEKEPVEWNLNTPNERIVSDYENLIDRILTERKSVLDFTDAPIDGTPLSAFASIRPVVFTLSEGARKVLFQIQSRHARQAVSENAANAAARNKAGRIAARLCLTLHCVRSYELTDSPLKGTVTISKEIAESAATLTEWFINETVRVNAMLAGERIDGELTTEQREVMQVLRNAEKPLTERELKRASRKIQRIENLDIVLRQLVQMGKIQDQNRNNGYHTNGALEYQISTVDTVDVDTMSKNTGENRHSVNVNTTKNAFSDTADLSETPPEPATVPSGFTATQLRTMIADAIAEDPGSVTFDEILTDHFNGDRVPTMEFLTAHGFSVKETDGKSVVVPILPPPIQDNHRY